MSERITVPTSLGLIVAETQHNAACDGVTVFICQDSMMCKIGSFTVRRGKDTLRADIYGNLRGVAPTTTDYVNSRQVDAFFDHWRDFAAMFK